MTPQTLAFGSQIERDNRSGVAWTRVRRRMSILVLRGQLAFLSLVLSLQLGDGCVVLSGFVLPVCTKLLVLGLERGFQIMSPLCL